MNDGKELDLIYKEYEELRNSEQINYMRETHKLSHIAIEITKRCNARCEHCSVSAEAEADKEELTAEEWKNALKDIADHYDAKTMSIGFTGGEPLVRKDFLEILKYGKELGFRMTITTNGVLLTDSMIEKLYNLNIVTVAVSIDGLEKTHEEFRKLPGCYPKLLRSLRKMLEYKNLTVGVTTVVSKKSINELEELYKQFVDIGIHFWRVFTVDPHGRALENEDIFLDKEDYEKVFDFIEEKNKEGKLPITYGCNHFLGLEREKRVRGNTCFTCSTGLILCTILNNGDIFGCSNIPRRPELIQGNIKKESLHDVWENRFEIYRDPNKLANKKCNGCKYWRYCRGDGMHSFDFDNREPLVCMKDILGFE